MPHSTLDKKAFSRLLVARIRTEQERGSSPREALAIVRDMYENQCSADEAAVEAEIVTPIATEN